MFNTTFNNISVISWWSVLLVEENKVLEKTTDLSQVTDKTLSHTTQQCPNVRELYMQVQI
jgi:hypothetical protein